ncbi:hypothetical protein KAFR_0D00520 [Kazachstania africana CBS 2517]|uniref:Amino acid permease/ SLC12A domain-containing protein n=1 Tax=Kazachstania africana (strain ATCC 22294 / BCRC 22015 / CBS 2517 / CECT 1963 / NBRC 1671 / NRRL Y-8276) TaxID=1071382 RepID=H2ATJ9_KAZAF|nr:hypothetical protein KAFR_0D00520 [Kazachstania africana CBS 2517]CCF57699.1 hypothetical protein KAFR_0D00520 [Kazachstania africana CBS 2517]
MSSLSPSITKDGLHLSVNKNVIVTNENQINESHSKLIENLKDFVDSFKKIDDNNNQYEIEKNEINNIKSDQFNDKLNNQLQKTIQPRHVIMISLGTGIGTGLLVGNGATLHNAGPAGLLIGYIIMASCIYCIIQACGEMAVNYLTLIGGFNNYPSFLVDTAWNFAVAWVYCIQWLCVCPLELVTASMTIKYWNEKVDPDVFVTIFYLLIIAINLFGGARGYAEAEFFFNLCKILMIAGFFILGIILICGGAGTSGYIGVSYWNNPGAFRGHTPGTRFKGIVSTLVTAAFSFGQTEFLAITASEQSNPRKAIPSAAKKVIYRALFIYVGSIIIVGFLVPYNSPELLGSKSSQTKASPYVIAVASHGIRIAPHFINAVILISVLSVANSSFYSSSRMLLTLAKQGYAPKIFTYLDRKGRPLFGIIAASLLATIAFCASSPKETEVFSWLLAISGLSQVFTWGTICLSHIRFRRAMKIQGRSLNELGYKSQVGVWGSIYAATVMFLILIGQFWVALWPLNSNGANITNFFKEYLAMPILLLFYFGYKTWKKDWNLFIRAKDIDLISHRHIYDEDVLKQEKNQYKENLKNGSLWLKIYAFWC